MATKRAAAQAGEHITEMLPFDVPVDVSVADETAEEPKAAAVAGEEASMGANALAEGAVAGDAEVERVAGGGAGGDDAAAGDDDAAGVVDALAASDADEAEAPAKAGDADATPEEDADPTAEDTEAAETARKAKAAAALLALKDAVRREALSRRQELRPATRSARSRDICNQLLSDLRASGIKGRNGRLATISVYAALRFEVDLDRFIRGAYALGYRIAFPCMTPKDRASDRSAGMMCMRSVSCLNYVGGSVPFIVDPRKPWGPAVAEEHQQFTNTPTGSRRRFIPSRVKGSIPPKDDTRFPVVPPSEIDMAIIPAVAFDAEGRRLGYGTGVYDRYMPQLREDCRVVGVAFAEQEVTEVPSDEHDCVLSHYITA